MIRREQADALAPVMVESFLERAVRHVRTVLPEQTGSLTDAALRPRIQAAARRAPKYGLTTEQEVICYVDASLLLGDRFETDARHAWAQTLLHNAEMESGLKAVALYAGAVQHAEARP